MKSLVLFVGVFALTGCVGGADMEEPLDSIGTQSQELSKADVLDAKAQIRQIALANIDRSDNWQEVRTQLEPSIQRLVAFYGARPLEQKLGVVAGAWRQIWSDFPYMSAGPISMDSRQVYQVVTKDGYYYNLGNNKALGILPLTGVLRGAYEPDGDKLTIRFTRVGFRLGHLDQSRDLNDLVGGLESGKDYVIPIPGGGAAPNGPVNVSGKLKNLYADEDLRIDIGSQDAFVDEQGKERLTGVKDRYFVLDRVTTPVH